MAILDHRNSLDLQGGSRKIKLRLFFTKKGDFILMLFITTLSIIDEEDYFYRIHAVSAMCKDADVRSWYNSFGANDVSSEGEGKGGGSKITDFT